MTNSPWAGLDPALLSATEKKLMYDECAEILTRIKELVHFAKNDGTVDDIRALRLFLISVCFIGFANRKPEVTDMDLKAVLQSEYDEAFHAARLIVNSTKGTPPL